MKTAKWLVWCTLKKIQARFQPATAGLLSVLLMFSLVSPSVSIARSEKKQTDSHYAESKDDHNDTDKKDREKEESRDRDEDGDRRDDQETKVETETPKHQEGNETKNDQRNDKKESKPDDALQRPNDKKDTGKNNDNTVTRQVETVPLPAVKDKSRRIAVEQTRNTSNDGADRQITPLAADTAGHQTNGAIWTSDVNGNVNLNHYDSKPEVYLNGGPRGGSNSGLTDGEYHWRITDPNGGVILGSSGGRTFTVSGGRMPRFSLWHWNPPASHYADTPNNGGVYKVIISRNPDFPSNETKSDSFKVYRPAPEPPTVNGLSIDKTDEKDPVALGEPINYQIAVTNKGDTTQTGVTVTDTLPDGLFYVSSLPTPLPPATGPVLVWSVGTLGPDQTAFIDVTVGANRADIFINRAQARSDQTDDVTDDEDTTVTKPDDEDENCLRVVKSDTGSDPVAAGQNITYKIAVTNTDDETEKDVRVVDNLPAGLTYVSSSPAADSLNPPTWNLGDLQTGETKEITLVAATAGAGVYRNVVNVTHGDGDSEHDENGGDHDGKNGGNRGNSEGDGDHDGGIGNGDGDVQGDGDNCPASDDETTTVTPPTATITKVDSADPIKIGEETTYTITVTNDSSIALSNLVIEDELPAEMALVTTVPTADQTSPKLSWNVGALLAGASTSVQVRARGTAAGSWTNKAEARATELGDPIKVTEPTTVLTEATRASYSLGITKIDTVDPVELGGDTDYIIQVTNTGNAVLTKVKLADVLPSGFDFVSTSVAPESMNGGPSWDLGTMEPGAVKEVRVTAKGKKVGTHTNTAEATAKELGDKVRADQPTRVVAPPVVAPATYDLSIEKTDDVDPAAVGDTVTYTITVENTGDQPLTGLDLRDSLPAGVEFKGSNAGVEKLNSTGVYGWSIDSLEPGEIRNFVMTTTAKEAGTWTNIVAITADELPTAKEAVEQTRVLPATVLASQTTNRSASGSLPFTGFPLTMWLLTSLAVIMGGLGLEMSARRRRALAQSK